MDVFLIPSSLMLVWDASVSLAEMGVVLVEKWFWVAAEVMPPVVSGCVAGWLVEGLLLGMPVDILLGGCEFRVGLGLMRFFFGVEEEDISKEEFTYFLRKKMGKHLLACLHVSASRLLVTRERGMY